MMMFWKGYSKKLEIVLDELDEGFKILVEVLIINMTNINALSNLLPMEKSLTFLF